MQPVQEAAAEEAVSQVVQEAAKVARVRNHEHAVVEGCRLIAMIHMIVIPVILVTKRKECIELKYKI